MSHKGQEQSAMTLSSAVQMVFLKSGTTMNYQQEGKECSEKAASEMKLELIWNQGEVMP